MYQFLIWPGFYSKQKRSPMQAEGVIEGPCNMWTFLYLIIATDNCLKQILPIQANIIQKLYAPRMDCAVSPSEREFLFWAGFFAVVMYSVEPSWHVLWWVGISKGDFVLYRVQNSLKFVCLAYWQYTALLIMLLAWQTQLDCSSQVGVELPHI